MAGPLLAMMGAGAVLGYAQGQSALGMARYEARIARANADLVRAQADRVLQKADKEANFSLNIGRRIVGQQRATAAASNIATNTGNIQQLQEETEIAALNQAKTIRNNAFLEAMGLKSQALNFEFKADAAVNQAQANVLMSTISGTMSGFSAGGGFSSLKGGGGPAVPAAPEMTGDSNLTSTGYSLGSDYNMGSQYFSAPAGGGMAPSTTTARSYLGSERYVW